MMLGPNTKSDPSGKYGSTSQTVSCDRKDYSNKVSSRVGDGKQHRWLNHTPELLGFEKGQNVSDS